MKQLLAYILLLASLTACTGASQVRKHNCSYSGELCVEIRAVEPIHYGKPINIMITVTGEKGFPEIGISLSHNVDVLVEGPQGWENEAHGASFFNGVTSWMSEVEANKTLAIQRTLYLPTREGKFYIGVSVTTTELRAEDMIRIYMTQDGGKVYLVGTSIPITQEPLPLNTPGPTPTHIPTDVIPTFLPTFTPTPWDTPAGLDAPSYPYP